MKTYGVLLLSILFLCSCCDKESEKEKEGIPVWDGKSDLGGAHHGEAVSILWIEPISGMSACWYPLKGVTDVVQMREMIVRLNFPETPGEYELDSRRYLLVYFLRRDLHAAAVLRIPFLIDGDEFVFLRGKDSRLYELLMSAEERENYYGDPRLGDKIIQSEEYKEHWRSQLIRDPNSLPASENGDY